MKAKRQFVCVNLTLDTGQVQMLKPNPAQWSKMMPCPSLLVLFFIMNITKPAVWNKNKLAKHRIEDTQVGYILQKITSDKYTLEKYT